MNRSLLQKLVLFVLVSLLCVMPLSVNAQDTDELFLDVGEQVPITILINSGPWFAGFEALVNLYQEQTGNQITLDVNPYPAMLEKIRNAVRDAESPYDLMSIDAKWVIELYEGEFLAAIDEIDPEFELDLAVIDYADSLYWNADARWATEDGGRLITLPINGNLTVLYYRADLYEEAGLEPPETLEDIEAACEVLETSDRYCWVVRSEGGGNFFEPYIPSFGGSTLADPANGDYTVTINSPEGLAALMEVVEQAQQHGPPNQGAINQDDMIQLMATGNVVHMINVVAAWPNFDDPQRSNVVGAVEMAVPPYPEGGQPASAIANWIAGVPYNIPNERKQAALAFMRWFLTAEAQYVYAEAGAVPVRSDTYQSDLAGEDRFRWFNAYNEVIEFGYQPQLFAESSQITDSMNVRLNQAIIGELTPAQALNRMAEDFHRTFTESGRQTGMLDLLPE